MHVDTICPGCQRKLRVPREHAGQSARCPICNTVYTVPETVTPAEVHDPHNSWRLKTPEVQEYGPVTRASLETWVAEGRVSADCQLICEADGVWQSADNVYPVLRPAPIGVPTPMWHNSPAKIADAAGPPVMPIGRAGRVINSDRGGIILALGILSWAIGCPIFGVLAWVMGSNDLNEMHQGTMDPRGQGMTEAGRIIGMIHAILFLGFIVFGVFTVVFWAFFR